MKFFFVKPGTALEWIYMTNLFKQPINSIVTVYTIQVGIYIRIFSFYTQPIILVILLLLILFF